MTPPQTLAALRPPVRSIESVLASPWARLLVPSLSDLFFIAMVVALLGVGAASIHFLARPHIFTLLLLSVSMWILEADRSRPSRRVWWLVPLTVVWTNLHGGFLVLIATLGLAAAGTAVEAW